ncbi:MAG: hypothetical protein ACKORL_13435, partial [Phycisphaerales bacterium]
VAHRPRRGRRTASPGRTRQPSVALGGRPTVRGAAHARGTHRGRLVFPDGDPVGKPAPEASEFIDCLHPLDIESGGLGRRLADRIAAGEHQPPSMRASGVRGPAYRRAPAERDRWLPRPTG